MAGKSYTGVQPKFTNRIKTSQIKYVCDVQSLDFATAASDDTSYSALQDFDDIWGDISGTLPNSVEAVTEGTFVTHFTPSYNSSSPEIQEYASNQLLLDIDKNPFTYLTVPVKGVDREGATNNLDRVLQECAIFVEGTVYFRESIRGINNPDLNAVNSTPIPGVAIEFEHQGVRMWYDGNSTPQEQEYTKFFNSNLTSLQSTIYAPDNTLDGALLTAEDRKLVNAPYASPVKHTGVDFSLPNVTHPIIFDYENNWWECKLLINEIVNKNYPLSTLNPDTPYSIIVKGKYLLM